jgi:hypothetical protein
MDKWYWFELESSYGILCLQSDGKLLRSDEYSEYNFSGNTYFVSSLDLDWFKEHAYLVELGTNCGCDGSGIIELKDKKIIKNCTCTMNYFPEDKEYQDKSTVDLSLLVPPNPATPPDLTLKPSDLPLNLSDKKTPLFWLCYYTFGTGGLLIATFLGIVAVMYHFLCRLFL